MNHGVDNPQHAGGLSRFDAYPDKDRSPAALTTLRRARVRRELRVSRDPRSLRQPNHQLGCQLDGYSGLISSGPGSRLTLRTQVCHSRVPRLDLVNRAAVGVRCQRSRSQCRAVEAVQSGRRWVAQGAALPDWRRGRGGVGSPRVARSPSVRRCDLQTPWPR